MRRRRFANKSIDVVLTQRYLPEHGGSIRWLHEVYRRWPNQVHVVTHDYGRETVAETNLRLHRHDILLEDWGVDRPHRWKRYLRMARLVARRHRPGYLLRVHCGHVLPEALALLPLRLLPRYGSSLQIVAYAHGEEFLAYASSRQLRLLQRIAIGLTDVVIANSSTTARRVRSVAPNVKIAVVHPGTCVAEFSRTPQLGEEWRRHTNTNDRLIILSLGRLVPRKNHATLIHAVARLAPKIPALLLVIAGTGPTLPELRSLTAQLGIGKHVQFLTEVDDRLRLALFGAMDFFAMPAIETSTDAEGFGIVFIEAAACGKPSIAGNIGGQPEAVLDQETGLVVDGRSVACVTDAITQLASQPALRKRLGANGRHWAARHDWDLVTQRIHSTVRNLQRPYRRQRA